MATEDMNPQNASEPAPVETVPSETVMPAAPIDTTMKMPGGTPEPETPQVPYLAITIGVLILLIALTIGGLYLWGSLIVKEAADEDTSETAAATSTAEEAAPAPTDSIESIEADLERENFDSINAELDAIDAEIEGSATTTP